MAKSRNTVKDGERYLVIPEVKLSCSYPQDALVALLYRALVEDDLLCLGLTEDRIPRTPFKFPARQRKSLTSKGIPPQLLDLLEQAQPMLAESYMDLGSLVVVSDDQAWGLIQAFDWASLPLYLEDQFRLAEDMHAWLNDSSLDVPLNLKSVLPIVLDPILIQALRIGITQALPGYEDYVRCTAAVMRSGPQQEIASAIQLLKKNGYTVTRSGAQDL